MFLSMEFLFGLDAYVRQAALSLDRTPQNDFGALVTFYAENRIPAPEQVAEQLVRHLPGGDLAVKRSLRAVVGLLSGRLAVLDEDRLMELKLALDEYGCLLRQQSPSSAEVRGRLRLRLSYADAYLWRALGARRERKIAQVDHLNSALKHPHKSLREIVGDHWPR